MKVRLLLAVSVALALIATSADARSRKKQKPRDSRVVALLERLVADNKKMRAELDAIGKKLNPHIIASAPDLPAPSSNPLLAVAPMPIPNPYTPPTIKGYANHIAKSAKVKDLTPRLASKVTEILAACPGSKVTSAYRRGARVAGTRKASLHSHYPSKAVDMAGNPRCIKRMLAGWKGGLSTDYAAVRHYHVSYAPGSREWGARFAHRSGSRYARYARHHRRYAAVR